MKLTPLLNDGSDSGGIAAPAITGSAADVVPARRA